MDPGFHRGDDKARMTETGLDFQSTSTWSRGRFTDPTATTLRRSLLSRNYRRIELAYFRSRTSLATPWSCFRSASLGPTRALRLAARHLHSKKALPIDSDRCRSPGRKQKPSCRIHPAHGAQLRRSPSRRFSAWLALPSLPRFLAL